MSDQDFFFDEEEQVAKEAPKTSSKSTKAAAPKADKAAPVARKASPAPAPRPAGGIFEQSVSMTVAALMTVIGILVGVIIGFVVAPDGATVSTGTTPTTTGAGATSTAPQLSEDQLNSGSLPEGHPDISSVATDTATAPSE